jgi:hypothetical protein
VPTDDGKRVRGSVPRAWGTLPLTLCADLLLAPRQKPLRHLPGGTIPGDFHSRCCYPPPTWKKRTTTNISRQTENDRCVIVLSNVGSDDVSRIADDIGDFFARRYLGVAAGPEAPTTRLLPRAAAVSPSELSRVTGFYRNRDGIYTGMVKDGDRLFYLDFEKGSGLQIAWELTPLDGGRFQLSHNPSFRCDFAAEPGAGIIRLSASRNGLTFNTAERCIPDKFELSAYAGVFTSLELQRSFQFEAADEVLKVRDFLGESEVLLRPLEKDLFGFPRGFMRFHRDAKGALDGFDVFTKDTEKWFGSKFIRIVY